MKNQEIVFARAKKNLHGYQTGEVVCLIPAFGKLTLFVDINSKNPRTFPPNDLDFCQD